MMEQMIPALIAQVERAIVAHNLKCFMDAAKAAHDIDEGRMREDFLALAQAQLAEINADNSGSRAAGDDDKGPRAVFNGSKLVAPNGTEWDLG